MDAVRKMPMALSAETPPLRLVTPMRYAVRRQKATDVHVTLTPRSSPSATPPKAAWDIPCPTKAQRLRTT